MEMTATQLRKNLFASLEKVIEGEDITIVYKGVPLTISAPPKTSKLARLKPQQVMIGDDDITETSRQLLVEMEKLWEEDWKDL